MSKNVTIIIPAFNSATLVSRSIASVKDTVDVRHHVIIIDDCSTEKDFEKQIRETIGSAENIRYCRNPKNLGFIGSCIAAEALADPATDILLLNSDAVLTQGAAEEMISCLALSDRHGVSCPRSNAATLLTIPQLHTPVDDQRRRSFECWKKMSPLLPRYTVIPTGVGFCMAIKRDLIRRFGFFDPIYGRGYNEENDFCMRIARFGFSTVMANRAYVFHDEGGSFSSDEKKALEEKNGKILRKRYPEYAERVKKYFLTLPRIEHFADVCGGFYTKKKILIDLSGLISAYNGTSEFALSLVEKLFPLLAKNADVFLMISKPADEFFGVSSQYDRVLFMEDRNDIRFDLALVPQQIFSVNHLERLHHYALRWVICMQDVISLRCPSITAGGSEEIVRLCARFASCIYSVSMASLDDFCAWMALPLRANLLTGAVLHAYPEKQVGSTDEVIPDGEMPTEDFIFVVGNHYDHKAIKETLNVLPKTRKIVVLGDRIHRTLCQKNNATLIESGKLSHRFVASLYKTASVVVFPSQYEGFGLPFLHAALAGTHVIAFDSDVSREVVAAFDLGTRVTLCQDFSELASALDTVPSAKHPVPELQRSWSDVAKQTAELIHTTLCQEIDTDLLRERTEFFDGCNVMRGQLFHEMHSVRWVVRVIKNRIVRLVQKIYEKITCMR